MAMDSTATDLEVQFEKDKTGTYLSAHYIFHFRPGSLAEQDILLIAQTQERCYAKICRTLGTEHSEKIHYYFADSPLEIGRIFWGEGSACNGCALFWKNTVYAVYGETIKCLGSHEDTHVIAHQIGFPESDFLVEGLAMAMDGVWWGLPNEVWASYHKARYPDLSLEALLDNDSFGACSCEISYPIAGAFTRYVIDIFGIDRYIELYRHNSADYAEIFPSVFGSSLIDIAHSFWTALANTPFDPAQLEQMLRAEGF